MLLDLDFDVGTRDLRPAGLSAEAERQVERFLFAEARLLDERRFEAWLALWTEDGMYWMPRRPQQESPYDHISLFWDDAMLRRVRVRRLDHPRNWSQQPPTRAVRLVGNVTIDGLDDGGNLVVSSVLQVTEWRRELRHLAARVTHKLAGVAAGGWQIRLKRVDLVQCDAVLDNLEVYL